MTTGNIYSYNANPSPQGGTSAFGMVPGNIPLPNPAADLGNQYPNLPGTNSAVSGDILSKLGGQLSPATIQQLQNASATYGVQNGMPGSNAIPGSLPYSMNLESLGLNSEAQQQQGIQDYNSTIPTVSGTQTVAPALQANIAETNALNAAAPNPAASASYAEELYNQYLNQTKSKGSVPGPSVSGLNRSPAGTPAGTTSAMPVAPVTAPGQSGSFYNGVWYPGTTGPTSTLSIPGGNMYGGSGVDPNTGLPWDQTEIDPATGMPAYYSTAGAADDSSYAGQ